jgi:hypothetical protein
LRSSYLLVRLPSLFFSSYRAHLRTLYSLFLFLEFYRRTYNAKKAGGSSKIAAAKGAAAVVAKKTN